MPNDVHDRADVQRLIANEVQVVEVLGPEEFERDHFPGAVNIPLRRIEDARELLDRSRPVLVYCWDSA